MTAPSVSVLETERQVSAAAERHREVLASKEAGGRPASGQHAADKAVGRSLQLMAFVLKRAAAAGVTVERLAELSAWTPEIVRQALERRPDQELAARVAPGHDPVAVARAAASFEAGRRVHALLEQVRADIDDDTWSPAASDLDDLRERLESDWRGWRRTLQRA